MVRFLASLSKEASQRPEPGRPPFAAAGGPWEFNLRDLLRWCQLIESDVENPVANLANSKAAEDAAEHFTWMLFIQRLRDLRDRERVVELWHEATGKTHSKQPTLCGVPGTMAVELTPEVGGSPLRTGPRQLPIASLIRLSQPVTKLCMVLC